MVATGRRNLPPAPDGIRYTSDTVARELLFLGYEDGLAGRQEPVTLHSPHLVEAYEDGRGIGQAHRAAAARP